MPPGPRLRLLTRPDCGLCEDVELALRRLRVAFTTVNIEDDAALEERYRELIPVLLDGDEEIARAPISRADLELARQRLTRVSK